MSTGRRGAALVVVIWSLAVMSLVAAAFLSRGALLAEQVHAEKVEVEAGSWAKAGVVRFLQLFLEDRDELDTADEDWLDPKFVDPAGQGGAVSMTVWDCGSRINLNLAGEAQLAVLFADDPEAVEAVLDWRDPDQTPRPSGAEQDYYGALQPPVAAADGFFRCPEEVGMVKGVSGGAIAAATIFGRANPNLIESGVWRGILLAAGEREWVADLLAEQFIAAKSAAARTGSVPFRTLEDLRQLPGVTYQTIDRLRPFLVCAGSINPNLGTETDLRGGLVLLGLKPEKAAAIVRARAEGPFTNLDELRAVLSRDETRPPSAEWVAQVFTLQTTLAGVRAEGSLSGGAGYVIEAVIERYHPDDHTDAWQSRVWYWRERPLAAAAGAGEEE